MKRKVLVNGRNAALVADLIEHTEAFFDMLSTSECWADVFNHFKLFDPEVYVCFVDPEYEKTIRHLQTLKTSGYYNGAVIVLIADASTCNRMEDTWKYSADLLMRRPITPDNLTLRITRYFEDMSEARERAEKTKQQRQAAEEAKAAEALAKEIETRAANEIDAAKKHILIVDDDRTVLKMLKTALGDEYDVTTMINGVMIEKFLDAKPVDMIILDYEMPIETGADIFKRLKNNPKAAHIPVCFLTGVSEKEKIMEVMSLKPDGYLLKPIDMDMLSATIRNLTD